jgi:hypothetical protein
MRLMIVPDIVFPSVVRKEQCGNRRPNIALLASFLLCFGHKSTVAPQFLVHNCAISQFEAPQL